MLIQFIDKLIGSSTNWGDSASLYDDGNALNLFIHMEFCNYKPLTAFLIENQTFEGRDPELRRIFDNLSRGLEAIHRENIIHRDLKPANVICAKSFYTGHMHYKIADFGLSLNQGYNEPNLVLLGGEESLENLGLLDNPTFKGTLSYRSPEMMEQVESYTEKTDVFSLGLIFLELLCPQLLDREKKIELFTKLQLGIIKSDNIPTECLPAGIGYQNEINIIKRMLQMDPTQRPSATEICTAVKQPINFGIVTPTKHFVGRDAELEKIRSIFTESYKVLITSESPGMGKTELAAQFLQEYRQNRKINLIWISTRTSASQSLSSTIEELASELDVSTRFTSPIPLNRETSHIFNDICLAIVNNYGSFETLFVVDSVQDQDWILRVLHHHKIPSIYIIDSEYNVTQPTESIVEVAPFSDVEAKRYLSFFIGTSFSEYEVGVICSVTENHIAAISQVAKILSSLKPEEQQPQNIAFIQKIPEQFKEILRQFRDEPENEWSDVEYHHAASIALTIKFLTGDHLADIPVKTAVLVLQILKYVDNTGTNLNTIQKLCSGIAGSSESEIDSALRTLSELDLVALPDGFVETPKKITYDVLCIDEILSNFEQNEIIIGMQILRELAKSTPTSIMDSQFFWMMTPYKNKEMVEEFADSILSNIQQQNNAHLHQISKHCLDYNYSIFKQTLGEDDKRTLQLEFELAKSYGNLEETALEFEAYCALKEKCQNVFQDPHEEFLLQINTAMGNNLGRCGKLAEALQTFQDNLDLLQTCDETTRDIRAVIATKNHIASVLMQLERYDEAEQILHEVLIWRSQNLGEIHFVTLKTKGDLATLYLFQDKYAMARDKFEEVVAQEMEAYGHETATLEDMLDHKRSLALCYIALGERPKAQAIFRESYQTHKNALGDDHPTTKKAKQFLDTLNEAGVNVS